MTSPSENALKIRRQSGDIPTVMRHRKRLSPEEMKALNKLAAPMTADPDRRSLEQVTAEVEVIERLTFEAAIEDARRASEAAGAIARGHPDPSPGLTKAARDHINRELAKRAVEGRT